MPCPQDPAHLHLRPRGQVLWGQGKLLLQLCPLCAHSSHSATLVPSQVLWALGGSTCPAGGLSPAEPGGGAQEEQFIFCHDPLMGEQFLIVFCVCPSPASTSSGATIQHPLSFTHTLSNESPKTCGEVRAWGSGVCVDSRSPRQRSDVLGSAFAGAPLSGPF